MKIADLTGTVHVGAGQRFGEVTWFPLWTEAEQLPRLVPTTGLGFEESPTAQVDRLVVTNHSAVPGLLIQGETVRGGLQDRTCTATVLVPPNSRLEVPVACIERGRWSPGGAFERAAVTSPGIRSRHSTARVRSASGSPWVTDQPGTWSEIERLREGEAHLSPTSSYHDVRAGRRARQRHAEHPRPLDGQRGVVLGYGGRIRSVDLFGSGEDLGALWERLLDAARFEASFGPAVPVPAGRARRTIRALTSLRFRCSPALGLGEDLRSENEDLVANGLRYLDRVAHVAAFTPAAAP
jgi:hypothetical protein